MNEPIRLDGQRIEVQSVKIDPGIRITKDDLIDDSECPLVYLPAFQIWKSEIMRRMGFRV